MGTANILFGKHTLNEVKMIRKILKACVIIFIAYILLVVNASIVGLIYIKLNPGYATSKITFPFGTIAALLVIFEFLLFYRYKNKSRK